MQKEIRWIKSGIYRIPAATVKQLEPPYGNVRVVIFEWDYTREHPAGATHRIAGFLEAHNGVHLDDGYSEEMEYKAAALSEDMTVFPAEGSIVEEKDLVVVKLSEITERPAVDWW